MSTHEKHASAETHPAKAHAAEKQTAAIQIGPTPDACILIAKNSSNPKEKRILACLAGIHWIIAMHGKDNAPRIQAYTEAAAMSGKTEEELCRELATCEPTPGAFGEPYNFSWQSALVCFNALYHRLMAT